MKTDIVNLSTLTKKHGVRHMPFEPIIKAIEAFHLNYKANFVALSQSNIPEEKMKEIADKFFKSLNKSIDLVQVSILDIKRRALKLRMALIDKFGRLNESPRSNLFLGTRVKLEHAEENLKTARTFLENTKEKSIKFDIEKSITRIVVADKSLKDAIKELKSD